MDLVFEIRPNGEEGDVAKTPEGEAVAMICTSRNPNYGLLGNVPKEFYFLLPLVRDKPELAKKIARVRESRYRDHIKQTLIDIAKSH